MNSKGLAIVTGAGRGIGAAIAVGLAEDGYRVVLIARNREALEKRYHEIMSGGGNTQEPLLLPADITDYELLSDEITRMNHEFGPIDILVNSAAMHIKGSLNASVEEYREIVNTNQIAQYSLFKTVVGLMKRQKSGYIFNIASRSGKYGFPEGGIYGSTKFALVGLAESLFRDLTPLGIRITSLCPGYVNTPMARDARSPYSGDEMIQPCDLLNTVRYLLSLSPGACVREIVLEQEKNFL